MKIAFVNEYFWPFTPGGAEWSIYYLAKELVKKGHQVIVITPNYGAKPCEIIDGIKVFRFRFPFKLQKGQTSAPYYAHNNFLFYLYSGFWIWKYLRTEKPDIINAQNRYSLIGSFLAAKILRVPVVFTIRDNNSFCPTGMCTHHFDEKNPPQKCGFINFWQKCSEEYVRLYLKPENYISKIYRKLILLYFWFDTQMHQWFMNRTDGIIAVSKGILAMYQKANIIKGVKTKIIYNLPSAKMVVDKNELKSLEQKYGVSNKKVVLYAGKFSIGKGTPLLLRVADKIVRKRDDIIFLLVGKGELQGSHQNIRIITSLPHLEILKLYHLATVVVLPANMPDAFSRSLLEAMAQGRPLIGTRVGGIPEQIKNGYNGYLFNRGDEKGLRAAILKICDDDRLAKKMGEASLKLIKKKFDRLKIISDLLSFYQSIH